jgi:hypothetical protein
MNKDGTINLCYNSQLTGSAATTPPCGFSGGASGFHPSAGLYEINFGFQINLRFLSATLAPDSGFNNGLADDLWARPINSQTIRVFEYNITNPDGFVDTAFYLIVF